jgi:hypothetical protein
MYFPFRCTSTLFFSSLESIFASEQQAFRASLFIVEGFGSSAETAPAKANSSAPASTEAIRLVERSSIGDCLIHVHGLQFRPYS